MCMANVSWSELMQFVTLILVFATYIQNKKR